LINKSKLNPKWNDLYEEFVLNLDLLDASDKLRHVGWRGKCQNALIGGIYNDFSSILFCSCRFRPAAR